MASTEIQIVSNEKGEPTAVIVPIELWREIESERMLVQADQSGTSPGVSVQPARFEFWLAGIVTERPVRSGRVVKLQVSQRGTIGLARGSYAKLIVSPTIIPCAGNLSKSGDEFVGLVNTGDTDISITRLQSPSGWVGLGQYADYHEYRLVLGDCSTSNTPTGVSTCRPASVSTSSPASGSAILPPPAPTT